MKTNLEELLGRMGILVTFLLLRQNTTTEATYERKHLG